MALNDEKSYVLITPAKNEEKYIQKTLNSVVSQTVLPAKWLIVSDGSTDRTDKIVLDYCEKHDFIRLLRADGHETRNFSSKIMAFRFGAEKLKHFEYDLNYHLFLSILCEEYL